MTVRRIVLAAAVTLSFAAMSNASAQPLHRGSASQLFPRQTVPWAPPPSKPMSCLVCSDAFGGTTPTERGTGGTCSDAVTALNGQLRSTAGASCMAQNNTSKCNVVITYTVGCAQTAGTWSVSGYATFNCFDNFC